MSGDRIENLSIPFPNDRYKAMAKGYYRWRRVRKGYRAHCQGRVDKSVACVAPSATRKPVLSEAAAELG
jgi:hypothetical protein